MVRKRKDGASSSQVPNPKPAVPNPNRKPKRRKTRDASGPQSPPPPVQIRYEDMPLNHKKKFFINDDCGGGLKKYIEVISWLRSMGCFLGSVFDDIRNLNWVPSKGYPLLEVEVITPQGRSAKFIVYKNNLYLIGFRDGARWFQFKDCGFIIKDFTMLSDYDGSYGTYPWLTVGPKSMIDAVDTLALCRLDADGKMLSYQQAWDIFFFHLCEAGRYYPVESFVCKTLVAPENGKCVDRTYKDEEDAMVVMKNGRSISSEDDIYRQVEPRGCVDFQHERESPDYFRDLVKDYKKLSKVWYVKALTGGRLFPISDKLISQCHVRSRKSLRCTLAVLCNTNLDKIVDEWEGKIQGPEGLTREVFKEMETRVRELQEKREVMNPHEPVP